jgi:hypothetical protein
MRRTTSPKVILAAVVALVAAGVVGFLIGHRSHAAAFSVGPGLVYAGSKGGTAYIVADEPLNRQPTGFAYFVPPTVAWIDATGAVHEAGQRPACVPYNHPVRVKEIEAVIDRIGISTVLWVRC